MSYLVWAFRVAGCARFILATQCLWAQSPASLPDVDSGATVQVFAPGIVSTPFTEWATSMSPDGKTVYFSRGAVYWTIVFARLVNGRWADPEVASFSGRWSDTDPFVSPDGHRLYFISNRPLSNRPEDTAQKNYHIWFVERHSDDTWGEPHHLDAPINVGGVNNFGLSISRTGTLYFSSRDRNGHAGMSSYRAVQRGTGFAPPEYLALRDSQETQDPFIDPQERYLLFESGPDLYITEKTNAGWTSARKLSPLVNNGDYNSSPYVSPDQKTLFYSTSRVKGLYQRDVHRLPLTYQQLVNENNQVFNRSANILMVPWQEAAR